MIITYSLDFCLGVLVYYTTHYWIVNTALSLIHPVSDGVCVCSPRKKRKADEENKRLSVFLPVSHKSFFMSKSDKLYRITGNKANFNERLKVGTPYEYTDNPKAQVCHECYISVYSGAR